MKKVSIGFTLFEKIVSMTVLSIIFVSFCFQLFALLTNNPDIANKQYEAIQHNPSLLILFLAFRLFWLFAIISGVYYFGMTLTLYDDRLEYTWFKKVVRTIPIQDAEIHLYKSFFKTFVAVYDKKTNKIYQIYSKQRTKKFVGYVKEHNLAIIHDSPRYFLGYMKTNHPGFKKSF